MTERSIAHGSFTLERTYPVPPARVFKAWADPRQKALWFADASGEPQQVFEFKPGGREYSEGHHEGSTYTFDVRYCDIVPDNRIVYTYQMSLNGQNISVSVATIEFRPEGKSSTRMVINEMGAFLDGLDTNAQRREGTEQLIGQLGTFLDKNR
jgi:uncharacterized protein YndB with AHSA1/START domain